MLNNKTPLNMEINNKTLTSFISDFESAVKDLEKKYGVQIDLGNVRYSDFNFSTKMTVSNAGSKEEAAKRNWDLNCSLFGFKKEHFGQEILVTGKTMKIVGIKPRNRKYPIIVESAGTQYKISAATALRKL